MGEECGFVLFSAAVPSLLLFLTFVSALFPTRENAPFLYASLLLCIIVAVVAVDVLIFCNQTSCRYSQYTVVAVVVLIFCNQTSVDFL